MQQENGRFRTICQLCRHSSHSLPALFGGEGRNRPILRVESNRIVFYLLEIIEPACARHKQRSSLSVQRTTAEPSLSVQRRLLKIPLKISLKLVLVVSGSTGTPSLIQVVPPDHVGRFVQPLWVVGQSQDANGGKKLGCVLGRAAKRFQTQFRIRHQNGDVFVSEAQKFLDFGYTYTR